jgi:AcrR family transcriptional regulator
MSGAFYPQVLEWGSGGFCGVSEDCRARARGGPVSREQAREMQQRRILDATVGEVGERGVRGATVAGVTGRAGVSRSTFYEIFDDLEACILTALSEAATHSTTVISRAFAEHESWEDGVLAALVALLTSFDRDPLLARVCLLETLAGSAAVLDHRARELAALNSLVDVGRKELRRGGKVSELAAEASVAAVAGILHTRLVTGDAPPFIGLLGQMVGLVLTPYLDPADVVREVNRAEEMAYTIARGCSSTHATARLPSVLQNPGAYRARSCLAFLASNLGASNKAVAAGIGVSNLGQVSELLKRLASAGLLVKHSNGIGRPNSWWLTPQGERAAQALQNADVTQN